PIYVPCVFSTVLGWMNLPLVTALFYGVGAEGDVGKIFAPKRSQNKPMPITGRDGYAAGA
ncbi:MAG: hypothetical protein IJS87_09130, partial [Rhodocyclaceae bacterium]|nr:hypothetical protein [Rhodocyclaceae bacterium]